MSRIWTVARRELKALFDHPTAYVLLVVFLGVNAFLFFRQSYLAGSASLRPMLDLLPWVLLFFVPAVTMRSVAEDSRSGVLEVVLAQPLTELELIAGKYLGSVLFLWIALALTLPIPLALSLGADLQWGPILAQYIGSALLAAGLAGVGLWASSIAASQVTAFILAVIVMFALVLVGLNPLVVGLPPTLAAIAARLGVLSHFDSIGRGVIDLRDAIYFLSLAGVFLALAYGALVRRKLAPAGGAARRLRLGVGLLVAILVVVNLLGSYIRGRLDLTPGNAYTLSPATERIVAGLDDIITIKLFASKELPTEAALLKRDVDDLLHDLRSAGQGKVRVVQRDPAEDEAARRDAQALGIQPVQFNVIGQAE
ncbi:MAG TPA: Gldg family protein, partial [Gemmatimonadales bacterium]|nr:Gldg family protein [Gemmatimonadales bacterium]